MSRILKPVIGFYLVLCVAFAGAVGTSPVLHQWIEHGGNGAAHVHWQAASEGHQHQADAAHPHPHPHPHKNDAAKSASSYQDLLVHHGGGFRLPDFQILGRLFSLLLPVRSEGGQGKAHEHHSLAQLMAAGLVEHFVSPALGAFFIPSVVALGPMDNSSVVLSSWNPLACPRGPPSVCI